MYRLRWYCWAILSGGRFSELHIIIIIIIIIINGIYMAQNSQVEQMRQVSCCMISVILEQEHFQSFPEHWEWNVQQTEFGWKTVPHDWSVNGKTAVSVGCLRAWNGE